MVIRALKTGITAPVQSAIPVESVYFSMENGPLCLDELQKRVDRMLGMVLEGRAPEIGLVECSRPYVNHSRERRGYPRSIRVMHEWWWDILKAEQ